MPVTMTVLVVFKIHNESVKAIARNPSRLTPQLADLPGRARRWAVRRIEHLGDVASVVVPTVTAAVGVVAGAGLTGWFGILAKRKKRVQQRRAEVYVDVLAWIWSRMPELRRKLDSGNPDSVVKFVGSDKQISLPDTKPRTTFPDPAAIRDVESTDPGSQFFVVLRARVAVFASHDMARAFDRWTKAYTLTMKIAGHHKEHAEDDSKKHHPDDCGRCALLALVADGAAGTELGVWTWVKRLGKETDDVANRESGQADPQRLYSAEYGNTVTLWRTLAKETDDIDGQPGCLTRAVTACASAEIRKG